MIKNLLYTTSKTCVLSFSKFVATTILVLTLLLVFFGATSSHAQVATNYNFSESFANTYTPITGGTVLPGTTALNFVNATAPVNVALPFTFYYNNALVTSVTVYDNGFITFGNTVASVVIGVTTPISNGTAFAGAVACFGIALGGDTAITPEVSYLTTGVAPNRVFVTQYKDLRRRVSSISTIAGIINMQIRLNEFDNTIEVIYKDQFSSTVTGATPGQVGLRGATNAITDINNRKQKVGFDIWPSTDPGTANTDGLTVQGQAATPFILFGWKAGTKFVWTPCFSPTAITSTLLGDNTTLNINWTAPGIAPTGGYDWEVRTSGAAGSGASGLYASGNTALTAVSVPGLSDGITYSIYVKSNCKTTWTPSTPATISPVCPIMTIPYTQNFETAVVTAMPFCNTTVAGGTTMQTVDRTSTPLGGFANKNLVTVGALLSNSWYFTQQINFPVSGYYKLTYKYGGTSSVSIQKMKVAFGTVNTEVGMTSLLADHNDIKTSPLYNTINFYAAAGNYYLGFNGYAQATQGSLQLDDINLDYASCKPPPTNIASNQVYGTTATISWSAPAPAPAVGYQYLLSTTPPTVGTTKTAGTFNIGEIYQILTVGTTNYTLLGASANTVGVYFTSTGVGTGTGTANTIVPPANTITPTGTTSAGVVVTTLSGLANSTTYYIWVRSDCGGVDTSAWSEPNSFTTLPAPATTYCIPVGSNASSFFNNVTTTGATVNINNSSGYSAGGYGNYSNLVVSHFPGGSVNFTTGISGPAVGVAIWIDWNYNGTFEAGERVFNTSTYVSTLSGSFAIPVAQAIGEYRMRVLMDFNAPNPANPCGFVSGRGEVEDYTFKVVTAPPALTLNNNSVTQCPGINSSLIQITAGTSATTPAAFYNSFSWFPATGVTGNSVSGYTFNTTATTTFTLTATQSVYPFSTKTVTFVNNIYPAPTPLIVTPNPSTICQGSSVALVVTGGIVSGSTVLTENFNSGAPGWTTENTSTGGAIANAAWIIRNSGYNPAGSSGISSVVSNDNTAFNISNSDSQGSGTTTDVRLISPTFSLSGYSDASLSFYHYYKPWVIAACYAKVEIFSGGSWTTLQSWGLNQTQGTPTNFSNVVINLNAYIGQSGLQLRFNYYDKWGFVWAVDNVVITGSVIPTAVTWTPITNLFTDALTTIPYTAGTAATTVYAKPSVTATYTTNVTTLQGCTTTTNVVVNVTPSSTTATNGSTQTVCNSFGAILAGNTPTIGSGSWSVTGGPSALASQFSNVTNPTATFTANGGVGAYVVRWTISGNAPCTATTADATITVAGAPTTATNGSTQTVCNSFGATLSGNTPTVGTGSWSVFSGPSLLASQFSSLTNPAATFAANGGAGAYVVRWTISNAPCAASSADATITVAGAPTIATNGSAQTVCNLSGATLAGNTPTVGTGSWSVFSGPSLLASQFSSLTNPAAIFTADGGEGSYVVRWTISNTPCTASTADATITVAGAPTTATNASTQTVCYLTAILAANTPTVGTGSWSVLSGPSLLASQFSSLTNPAATFTANGGAGAYMVRWTISNAPCTASFADATVTVTAYSGGTATSNQTICYGAPASLNVSGFVGSVVKWQYSSTFSFGVPTDIASSAAAILTSGQMGVLVSRRYFRAVISDGTCTAFSNVITINISKATWDGVSWSNTVGPNSTMIAQFDGDYTSTGDLSACSVLVNGGNVIFASNHTLTVQNDVRMVTGSLTFENNSSLVQVNTLNNLGTAIFNTGNITYKRNTSPVRSTDFTYWSSPVTPQTLYNLSPLTSASKYFIWNSAAAVPNWVSVPSSTLMVKGKGYIIRAPYTFNSTVPAVYNGFFFGVPTTGKVLIPVIGTANPMNLLGNPYPSALDAISFLSQSTNATNLEGTIYFWTHNTLIAAGVYSASDYAVFNYSGSTATAAAASPGVNAGVIPNGKIASGQGFFIKGLNDGNATYTNAMRVSAGANNNNQFFRNATTPAAVAIINNLERHRVWLDISNATAAFKQILVGYIATATNGIDRGFDGEMVDSNPITLYSILGTKKWSIQGRSLPFDVNDTVPLGYKSTIAGSYTISLSNFDGLFESQDVYLEDIVLNVVHNLKTANYSFATEIGTFESRFILRYTPSSTLGIDTPNFDENTVVVYKNEQGVHINTGTNNMSSVAIYDLRGRLIASQKNIGLTVISFTTLPTTQQVLLVKITSEDGVVVTKKVVY